MQWASAISKSSRAVLAVAEAASAIEASLEGGAPDLVLAFASPALASSGEDLPALLSARFPKALIAGCSGRGVIGAGHEEEDLEALALVAAVLPDVQLSAFHVDITDLPEAGAPAAAWHRLAGVRPQSDPQFLVLADPFTFDAEQIIGPLDRAFPGAPKIGGLASGGGGPGGSRLYLRETTWRSGAVGLVLRGNVRMEAVVAQGCRPVGAPLLVTRCQDNVIQELNQQKPLEALRALFEHLPAKDQEALKGSVLIGLELEGGNVEFSGGELLVRNLVGVDPRAGTFAVGGPVRPFQVVQFVVRDARTATEDLGRALRAYVEGAGGTPPQGALLFSCTGRGRGLFGHEDHDTGMFQQLVGAVPLGGFFCNGEIGPVRESTFLHSYTSAFALFRPRRPVPSGL